MTRWKHPIVLVLLVTAGAFALPGCGGGESADTAEAVEDGTATGTDRARPVPVAVTTLEAGAAQASITAWGTMYPHREAVFLAEITGRVAAVHAKLGDRVERGRLLLEIDPQLHEARAAQARAAVRSTEVAAENAAKNRDRTVALYDRGTVSDSEVEAARTRSAETDAALTGAQASLAQAEKDLANARVRAPFDGQVATRPPDPGGSVTLGTELTRVVDIDRLRVEALVSEKDLAFVETGSVALLTVEAAPGRLFEGAVTAIGPAADPQTRQFPVEIALENPPDRPLRGGLVTRVEIVYASFPDAVLVPLDAVLEDETGPYVFTVQGETVSLRRLETGTRRDGYLAAVGGVSAGETVIVLGKERLTDGARVRIEETR